MDTPLVLALDTTTRGGSVSVTRGDEVLALVEGDDSRTHGERLPGEIDAALARAGVAKHSIDLLVVASGPGAFTGLRIGLAAVQGLALVLEKPVVGVSALEALAETAWMAMGVDRAWAVAPWMDAHRGEVFGAVYSSSMTTLIEVSAPAASAPQAMLDRLAPHRERDMAFVGDGAVTYKTLIQNADNPRWIAFDHVPPLTPALSRLGRRLAAKGLAGPPHALQPVYVRRPDAELERDRQVDR